MLIALYGECRANNQFPWSTKPEDYRPEPLGDGLHRIRAALCALRGHRDFIKSPVVPPCDYYVSGEKLIVEFDESQHFTRARLTALSLYSADAVASTPKTTRPSTATSGVPGMMSCAI
jgi:hypothetical protein